MTTPIAIIIASILLTTAMLIVGHWEIVPSAGASVYRLNRWTGSITACEPLDFLGAGEPASCSKP